MFLTQNQNSSQTQNMIIYIMYGGLALYFIYKYFKSFNERKKTKGEIHSFSKQTSKLILFLGGLIISFGLFNIFNGDLLSGILMLVLVIALFLDYSSKNIFAENGFIVDSKFVEWGSLKKWAFDSTRGELVVRYKEGFEEKSSYMKVRQEDITQINNIIRKYKLNK